MSGREIRPAELVRRTCQALSALYRAQAPENAVTLQQFSLLEALMRHGPQTEPAIAGLTRMDKSTLNTMAALLKKGGMLATVAVETQKPGPKPMALTITPRGIKAVRATEKAVWNAEVQLMSRLTQQHRAAFLAALNVTAFARPPE